MFDGLRGGRIIPANTGRIAGGGCRRSGRWDHPREYGENDKESGYSIRREGSSPRIRGEFHSLYDESVIGGIIPANTGRIYLASPMAFRHWDHPREYGENMMHNLIAAIQDGSSPRIRGEWHVVVDFVPYPWDHPREYGENHAVVFVD